MSLAARSFAGTSMFQLRKYSSFARLYILGSCRHDIWEPVCIALTYLRGKSRQQEAGEGVGEGSHVVLMSQRQQIKAQRLLERHDLRDTAHHIAVRQSMNHGRQACTSY